MTDWTNLADALDTIPRLPGAACVGRHQLFDGDDTEHHAAAVQICQHCPALQPCRDWFDALRPSQKPAGVTAGIVHEPPKRRGRPRKQAP